MGHQALTVHQPWAWAICAGHKDVENRRWSIATPQRLLVHAGRAETLDEHGLRQLARRGIPLDALAFSAVIGAVTVVDVVRDSPSPWAIRGQLHWLLDDPVLFERPIPWRGQPGLFKIPALSA